MAHTYKWGHLHYSYFYLSVLSTGQLQLMNLMWVDCKHFPCLLVVPHMLPPLDSDHSLVAVKPWTSVAFVESRAAERWAWSLLGGGQESGLFKGILLICSPLPSHPTPGADSVRECFLSLHVIWVFILSVKSCLRLAQNTAFILQASVWGSPFPYLREDLSFSLCSLSTQSCC